MKKLLADMHMHTLVSGHAYGTIREMAAAAAEKELSLICKKGLYKIRRTSYNLPIW